VARTDLRCLATLRRALPLTALVLDLSGEGDSELGWRSARQAAHADLILVGSLWELRELRRRWPSLAPKTVLFRRPLNLAGDASQHNLLLSRATEFSQFRRASGLTGPVVLFAGPYTEAGGLDLAIEAAARVAARNSDLRFAAILQGPTDRRFVERCRRRAASLAERFLMAASPPADDIALWYGAADVVCLPCREPVSAEPTRLAAAAGKPFVGSEVEPLLEHVVDGHTGFLLPVGDLETLTAALEALIGDREEARRLGQAARRKAEQDFSPAPAAKKLVGLWADAT
jgi:glycosyltransferase involved in cell wall biosynthesis